MGRAIFDYNKRQALFDNLCQFLPLPQLPKKWSEQKNHLTSFSKVQSKILTPSVYGSKNSKKLYELPSLSACLLFAVLIIRGYLLVPKNSLTSIIRGFWTKLPRKNVYTVHSCYSQDILRT